MLVLNYTRPDSALANVNIRQAVARAIDRKAIVKNVYYDLVQPITIPMPPSAPTYDPKIAAEWDFNLDAAAAYVKKSGLDQAGIRASGRQQRPGCAQGGRDHPR